MSGCDKVDEFNKQIEETRNELKTQIEETRGMVKQVSDNAIRAVPGERWLQLIDDLNSEDDATRTRAQDFLRRVGKIDIDNNYEASIWFGKPANMELDVSVLRASDRGLAVVESAALNGPLNFVNVANSLHPALDMEARLKRVEEACTNGLKKLVGTPEVQISSFSGENDAQVTENILWQGGLRTSGQFHTDGHVYNFNQGTLVNESNKVCGEAAGDIAKALIAFYEIDADPGEARLVLPWNALDSQQFLFVIVRARHFEDTKPNLSIKALVHRVGDKSVTLHGTYVRSIELDQFQRATVKDGNIDRDVYWAAFNMAGYLPLSKEQLQKAKELRDLLDEFTN